VALTGFDGRRQSTGARPDDDYVPKHAIMGGLERVCLRAGVELLHHDYSISPSAPNDMGKFDLAV